MPQLPEDEDKPRRAGALNAYERLAPAAAISDMPAAAQRNHPPTICLTGTAHPAPPSAPASGARGRHRCRKARRRTPTPCGPAPVGFAAAGGDRLQGGDAAAAALRRAIRVTTDRGPPSWVTDAKTIQRTERHRPRHFDQLAREAVSIPAAEREPPVATGARMVRPRVPPRSRQADELASPRAARACHAAIMPLRRRPSLSPRLVAAQAGAAKACAVAAVLRENATAMPIRCSLAGCPR